MVDALNSLFDVEWLVYLLETACLLFSNCCIARLVSSLNCQAQDSWRLLAFAAFNTLTIVIPLILFQASLLGALSQAGAPVLAVQVMCMFVYCRHPIWLALCRWSGGRMLGFDGARFRSSSLIILSLSQTFTIMAWLFEVYLALAAPRLIPMARVVLINLLAALSFYVLFVFLSRFIGRNTNKIKSFIETGRQPAPTPGFIYRLHVLLLWLVPAGLCFLGNPHAPDMVFTIIFLMILSAISLAFYFNNFLLRIQLFNTNAYNQLLIFRNTYDMSNVLQTYEAYISSRDYEQLTKYHNRVVRHHLWSNKDIFRVMGQFPDIKRSMLRAMQYAEVLGVDVQICDPLEFAKIDMDMAEFLEVMEALVANAVESAAGSERKKVIVSLAALPGARILVIVTNTAAGGADLSRIFQKGYSTKPGHGGLGLWQVNNIISKYRGSTIMGDSEPDLFTMYLNLPAGDGG